MLSEKPAGNIIPTPDDVAYNNRVSSDLHISENLAQYLNDPATYSVYPCPEYHDVADFREVRLQTIQEALHIRDECLQMSSCTNMLSTPPCNTSSYDEPGGGREDPFLESGLGTFNSQCLARLPTLEQIAEPYYDDTQALSYNEVSYTGSQFESSDVTFPTTIVLFTEVSQDSSLQ